MCKNIYGQDKIIESIVDISLNDNSFKSILLVGGVGVGKTLCVKELSKELNMNSIVIDMSEYSNYYSFSNIYNGENSLYDKLCDNSIILFDNIEKSNINVLNVILKIIDEKKIKDKILENSIIFLSATNNVRYNIGFNNGFSKIKYSNQRVVDSVDYIIEFNDIEEDSIIKYVEYNGIKDFQYDKCDYRTYGFRGVKISLNSKNIIK